MSGQICGISERRGVMSSMKLGAVFLLIAALVIGTVALFVGSGRYTE